MVATRNQEPCRASYGSCPQGSSICNNAIHSPCRFQAWSLIAEVFFLEKVFGCYISICSDWWRNCNVSYRFSTPSGDFSVFRKCFFRKKEDPELILSSSLDPILSRTPKEEEKKNVYIIFGVKRGSKGA